MSYNPDVYDTFVHLARDRAMIEPAKCAYSFLHFRPQPGETSLTMAELDLQARRVAARLQGRIEKGARVLLLFRPGIEFTGAFLGCLYAGAIAVPATVPRFGQGAARLKKIVNDADVAVVLSTNSVMKAVQPLLVETGDLEWIATEDLGDEVEQLWKDPDLRSDDLALLQYSSGSTGDPKGVMISHGNLMHQAALLRQASGGTRDSCSVSWLPTFHDLGLIAGVLQPLFAGYRAVLMAPESFVERPYRWLKAISDCRADLTFAPNFAYELCVRSVTQDELSTLDLSAWRFALNGAETVRARTIEEFSRRFAGCGFRAEAVFPAYGLAEATLVVSGGSPTGMATIRNFDASELNCNRAIAAVRAGSGERTLVASGMPLPGQQVRIVEPTAMRALGELEVGEVWVSGGSVGLGYWGRAEATDETFRARIAGEPSQHYLRTGDLGFLSGGELFICGRLKDLILIRGRNHHAPDIEHTVEHCHPALRPSCTAAFPVDLEGEERLVVVQELDREHDNLPATALSDIAARVREAIIEDHEIFTHAIVLIRHGTIPKTSSGKIQRRECRARFVSEGLKTRFIWTSPPSGALAAGGAQAAVGATIEAGRPAGAALKVEQWFTQQFANHGVPAERIAPQTPFAEYKLKPELANLIIRAAELEYRRPLSATLLDEFTCLAELAGYLGGRRVDGSARAAADASTIFVNDAEPSARRMTGEPIAIVGIGCRFPGADGPGAFWKNLCEGVDAVTEVPPERWDIDEVYDPNPLTVGKMNTRWGGFLKDIDLFDRQFFGLSIRELIRMDPQHRLMMEVAWEAMEDAGLVADRIAGTRTGVFVGISGSDYAQMQFGQASLADAYAGLGSALTIAASRVAYFLDLQGPAIAVDTACSSSLSALHLACSSLRSGECTTALAGGVNILLSPVVTMCLTKAGMMSPDGRCKAFDSRANGYVRAEGAGIVVLKPLSSAIADGDSIYAVIRGTASNQDGRSSGIAAPNGEAQKRVMLAACRDAGIVPARIDYVEAHGTGTAVGDPIEAKAIGEIATIDRAPGSHCGIGSVKTNIGHAESAAGIASLIKVALMMKHRAIPPTLHFQNPNPLIPFDSLPIRVQTTLEDVSGREQPLVVGVNGFGVGGTNVHAILEQAPAEPTGAAGEGDGKVDRPHVLPLSARSMNSLRGAAAATARALRSVQGVHELADLCYTAGVRRTQFEHRLAVVGVTADELADALDGYLDSGFHNGAVAGRVPGRDGLAPKLAFMFSGQGSQWWGMGRQLLACEPVFRKAIECCDALLRPLTGWSLLEVLHAAEADSRLNETAYAQPALFSLQVALAELWKSWGVSPDAVVGHSVGEVAAACVAGALTLEDAAVLIAHRARLMQEATGLGRMANVEMPLPEIEALLARHGDSVTIAAINSPTSIVLSGESKALEALLELIRGRGIIAVSLPVNYAFHSAQMEPFKHRLIEAVAMIRPRPASIPMMSTVTGQWCGSSLLDAAYWGDNVREPVRFADAVARIAQGDHYQFLEIGPHPVLSGSAAKTLKASGRADPIVPSLRRDDDDQAMLLKSFATLFTGGAVLGWEELNRGGRFCRELPGYCWDRQRFWLDAARKKPVKAGRVHPLLGSRLPVANPAWHCRVDLQGFPYLHSPGVRDRAQLSHGLLAEMAMAAASNQQTSTAPRLADMEFHEVPEAVRGADPLQLQATVLYERGGSRTVQIYAHPEESTDDADSWHLLLTAAVEQSGPGHRSALHLSISDLQAESAQMLSGAQAYQALRELGVVYDASAQVIESAWRSDHSTLLRIVLPDDASARMAGCFLHPLIVDAAEQANRIAVGLNAAAIRLARVQHVAVVRPWEEARYVYTRLREVLDAEHSVACGDTWILNGVGEIVALLEGVVAQRTNSASGDDDSIPQDPRQWLYDTDWRLHPLAAAAKAPDNSLGGWVVLADHNGLGDRIAGWLSQQGQRCVMVRHGLEFKADSGNGFTVNPAEPDQLQKALMEAARRNGHELQGVVHCWSVDSALSDVTTVAGIEADLRLGSISIVCTIQALSAVETRRPPRLWILTAAGQQVPGSMVPVSVTASTIWGLGKDITIEHPELKCCRIDLSPAMPTEEIDAVCAELGNGGGEDQLAFRGALRYIARLVRHTGPIRGLRGHSPEIVTGSIPEAGIYSLIATEENLDALVAHREPAGNLKPLEVEIRTGAVLLESMYADRPLPLTASGSPSCDHYSGTVVRVGAGVSDLRIGDEVIALGTGGLRSHFTIPAAAVVRTTHLATRGLSIIPVRPFVKALYALRRVGMIEAGRRVLIHGCDSPLGEAALQIARWVGAEVFVTVTKRSSRDSMLAHGVAGVYDANTLASFAAIRKITGSGVDIVLNCIDDFDVHLALPAVRVFGHCIDAARHTAARTAMTNRYAMSRNVSFHSIDVDQLLLERVEDARTLLHDVLKAVEGGELSAPAVTEVTVGKLVQAGGRSLLESADRNGPLAVVFPAAVDATEEPLPAGFKSDATYLITGGLGGLGLHIALRMTQGGARHLVLVARKQPSADALKLIAEMTRQGARVAVMSANVADEGEVSAMLGRIRETMPPLRGIIHAAGVLDNGLLVDMNEQRFRTVMLPKAYGAWHLHRHTAQDHLDFLVLFSSLSSVIGSPGQSNYSAANAFLDGLATYRCSKGLATLSIGWGPWAEIGMAADAHNQQRLESLGMGMLAPERALDLLEGLIHDHQGAIGALAMNWKLWSKAFPLAAESPFMSELMPRDVQGATIAQGMLTAQALARMPADQQLDETAAAIHRAVCKTLQLAPDQLGFDVPLSAIGLDSIVALELKNRIEANVDVVVRTPMLLKGPSIQQLASQLLLQMTESAAQAAATTDGSAVAGDDAASNEKVAGALREVGDLSDEEVKALLLEFAAARDQATA